MDFESRVFCDVGAWKSLDELEECLTLNELFILYDDVIDTEQRGHKVIASAMGAEVDWGEDDYSADDVFQNLSQGAVTQDHLPYGLGYNTIDNEE